MKRGSDWSQNIDKRLLTADFVLLLVSPALVASGYCYGAEVREAFERSRKGEARVIPIILHYVSLAGTLLEAIQPLPKNRRPVSSWPIRSEAWEDIDQGIRGVIRHYWPQSWLTQP